MRKNSSGKGLQLYILVFIIVCAVLFVNSSSSSSSNISSADGFTISSYEVILDVNNDNTVEVTENITVNFTSSTKHGIYRFIPEWLEYTDRDGNTVSRKSIITNYRAVGDPYTVDTVNKKERIKIGSASEYVGVGEKTYVIKYTYNMGADPYNGFDEFIFHAYGDYWGTTINNASLIINMPDDIENSTINFYLDKYRETNANSFVDYYVIGNSIYAQFNQDKYYEYQVNEYCSYEFHLDEDGNCIADEYSWIGADTLTESLTVDIELPEGYFTGGTWNYGFGSLILCLIVFAITIFIIYTWKKFGKNYPKRVRTIEFYPPENLSSAEIGYIYGKCYSNKLTVSLIVSLASKGYIKIDEIKDDKNKEQIQITNKVIAPSAVSIVNNKRAIEVEKLKDSDEYLSSEAKTMMKYLFLNVSNKKITSNIDKFLNVKDELVNNGYIKVISDINYEDEYKQKELEYNNEVREYEKLKENLPELNKYEKIVYKYLFENGNVIILSEHETMYKAFWDVESELNSSLKNLIEDNVSKKKRTICVLLTILSFILWYLSYGVVEDLDPSINIIYYLALLCIFVNIIFIFIMDRKTEYGEEIHAKILGFRDFLEKAEKEKLEALVLENPSYFYDILPYTYVLNVSKKWVSKFENIKVPNVDMGNFDYHDINCINHISNDIHYPASSSSGGGCSSCGGGCSSCGGGCSSCGGGGSW